MGGGCWSLGGGGGQQEEEAGHWEDEAGHWKVEAGQLKKEAGFWMMKDSLQKRQCKIFVNYQCDDGFDYQP